MPCFCYTLSKVTRDIIEGYMVEIKKAGGIGCFVKGTEDGGMFLSESPSAHDITASVDEPIGSSYAGNGGSQYNNRTQSHSDYIKRSKSFKDVSPKDYEQPRRINVDQRIVSQSKHDRENYSRSPERYKNRGRSHARSSHLLEQDDLEVTRIQHREVKQPSSGMSRYGNSRSSSSFSNSVNDVSVRKDEQKSKVEHRRLRNRYENVSSDFLRQNAFEDRYNPSESLDMYEDDLSTGIKRVRQDKLCLGEFHDQPSGYSAGRHSPDYHDKSE
jgi:U11/U12 small nuclear ribonucleoprotein SNRNP48